MPHCPLNKAAPLPLLKPRCEKSTLLYIHCLYLNYAFVLVAHKSLVAIFTPEPPDLWLGELWDRSWGSTWWARAMLFPCGLGLGQAHVWAQGSIIPICFFPLLYLGTETSQEPPQTLRAWDAAYQGNCAGIHVAWEMGVATFWYEFLFFFLNNWVSSEK